MACKEQSLASDHQSKYPVSLEMSVMVSWLAETYTLDPLSFSSATSSQHIEDCTLYRMFYALTRWGREPSRIPSSCFVCTSGGLRGLLPWAK